MQALPAKNLGVSDKTISAYELGRAIPPSTTIAKIAAVTGVPLNDFFANSQKRTSLEEIDKKINKLDKKLEEVKLLFSQALKEKKGV